jgi:hypothetical protein
MSVVVPETNDGVLQRVSKNFEIIILHYVNILCFGKFVDSPRHPTVLLQVIVRDP